MTISSSHVSPVEKRASRWQIFLPEDLRLGQDEEWCDAVLDGKRIRIRFHDYHLIYEIPGLYEQLFYETLECVSPRMVRTLLARALAEQGIDPAELRVLDVGAGNGMVGEEIRALGAGRVHGIDILEEAAQAAARDRAGVYDGYLVADLTALDPGRREELAALEFNAMTTVAALGFGDIPPAAFAAAFNLVGDPGLIAFTIKEDFVGADDPSGFNRLIERMLAEDVITPLVHERYRHRLSVRGEPLYYVAFVARKLRDIPGHWVD
ncbi:methyltransferase domain-containing protein [Pseudonocardia sp. MH-G8]|uniref:methyltransferase domain-containing protein n=1 Tax=Pseudonocardia sp. MH-G8 TaxID=1854588 RepID=UPI000BA189C9|nr:methyltransferase domain-containing protein [Pseudonocardia sp. MH-G8]OZM75723.1 methyltransferase [Pseudonocardia sp. MH-G8]